MERSLCKTNFSLCLYFILFYFNLDCVFFYFNLIFIFLYVLCFFPFFLLPFLFFDVCWRRLVSMTCKILCVDHKNAFIMRLLLWLLAYIYIHNYANDWWTGLKTAHTYKATVEHTETDINKYKYLCCLRYANKLDSFSLFSILKK